MYPGWIIFWEKQSLHGASKLTNVKKEEIVYKYIYYVVNSHKISMQLLKMTKVMYKITSCRALGR